MYISLISFIKITINLLCFFCLQIKGIQYEAAVEEMEKILEEKEGDRVKGELKTRNRLRYFCLFNFQQHKIINYSVLIQFIISLFNKLQ